MSLPVHTLSVLAALVSKHPSLALLKLFLATAARLSLRPLVYLFFTSYVLINVKNMHPLPILLTQLPCKQRSAPFLVDPYLERYAPLYTLTLLGYASLYSYAFGDNYLTPTCSFTQRSWLLTYLSRAIYWLFLPRLSSSKTPIRSFIEPLYCLLRTLPTRSSKCISWLSVMTDPL